MGLLHRLYADFFLPSRMDEYRRLLECALENDYQHLSLPAYFSLLKEGKADPSKKYFLHRHDIDTDPSTARRFFEIERSLNIRSSYYFRRSTLDIDLFREISSAGFEAGYHYEELSDYCKEKGIQKKDQLPSHYEEIRDRFRKNVHDMETSTGIKICSVAAHGDFVNRHLDVPNFAFVTDDLLQSLGIVLECYNPVLLGSFHFIGSDTSYPQFYRPYNPLRAIEEKVKVIYFLSHPRHWYCHIPWNLRDDLKRLKEGALYR
ncbi:MAG: hypothetical protein JNL88_05910 [Bacteroidia bacterium]|nr:hypothetical protein [Bacteroidia bacterium]